MSKELKIKYIERDWNGGTTYKFEYRIFKGRLTKKDGKFHRIDIESECGEEIGLYSIKPSTVKELPKIIDEKVNQFFVDMTDLINKIKEEYK